MHDSQRFVRRSGECVIPFVFFRGLTHPDSPTAFHFLRSLRSLRLKFFGGLRPRPGKIFGFVAVRVRGIGQGGVKPPQSPTQAVANSFLCGLCVRFSSAAETAAIQRVCGFSLRKRFFGGFRRKRSANCFFAFSAFFAAKFLRRTSSATRKRIRLRHRLVAGHWTRRRQAAAVPAQAVVFVLRLRNC